MMHALHVACMTTALILSGLFLPAGANAQDTGWGDLVHDDVTKAGYPVECFIAPVDFDLGNEHVLKGSWVIGMHYPDGRIWKGIVDGTLGAFSVGGFGLRED